MTTIRDVAQLVGVAPMIVSRVINQSDTVTERTRDHVEAAIEELGYMPNKLRPSLHPKQTKTLDLILSDTSNPFRTTMARGAEDAAHARGYHAIPSNTDESLAKHDQYLTMLLRRHIDGILLAPAYDSTA